MPVGNPVFFSMFFHDSLLLSSIHHSSPTGFLPPHDSPPAFWKLCGGLGGVDFSLVHWVAVVLLCYEPPPKYVLWAIL